MLNPFYAATCFTQVAFSMDGSKLPPVATAAGNGSDIRRMADGNPTRAADVNELYSLQKTTRLRDDMVEAGKAASISDTLRSMAREVGPRIASREPKHVYMPTSPRSKAAATAAASEGVRSMVGVMSDRGLKPVVVFHNLAPAELYEHSLLHEPGSAIMVSGALAALSGAKTGRSPKDKRVVREAESEADVWWGESSPNIEMDEATFVINRERAVDYLNMLDRLYVFDGYAGWDPEARYKIRVVCGRPYHALFMHNMLIRPTERELADFGVPDFTIYNAGAFPANRRTSYMTSSTSIDMSFKHREMVILGTQYAGEMKKGVFTLMNYWLPKRGILSLHSGCNVGAAGDVTLFFGLSGTGKTTLSADPRRPLIGDDEHGWGDNGVFNIEGGCYAKAIGLKAESEPEIYNAIRFGTVLENIVYDEEDRRVDFESGAITENTRASYPIEFIPNARIPCVGGHPKNIIMLCCDAFGVLPPVSKLTPSQAMYYFISGYTAKVAGTEQGITEPEATFSACFGSAFLVWHPMKYASMLEKKIARHGTNVWLINTGWTGGSYGVGYRFKLRHTRAIVDAIHSGELEKADYQSLPLFGLQVPTAVSGVPSELLLPSSSWADQESYSQTLNKLAGLFTRNFGKYADGGGHVSAQEAEAMFKAGPKL